MFLGLSFFIGRLEIVTASCWSFCDTFPGQFWEADKAPNAWYRWLVFVPFYRWGNQGSERLSKYSAKLFMIAWCGQDWELVLWLQDPWFFQHRESLPKYKESWRSFTPHGFPDSRWRGWGGGVRWREGRLVESRSVVPRPEWASTSPGDCSTYKSQRQP